METANFMLLEDNVPVYQTPDITSGEVAKLNSGDEVILDEKFKKNQIHWFSIVLPDDRKGYIRADAKGIKVSLMVLTQPSADVFETPGISAKVILTYQRGDKFQVIGGIKQDNLMWVKTESFAGVVGFMPANVRTKELTQITPSEKWPVRIGFIGGCVGLAIQFGLTSIYSSRGVTATEFAIAFFVAFFVAYFIAKIFIKIKHSISR